MKMKGSLSKRAIAGVVCIVCFTACDPAESYIANAHLYGARVAKVRNQVRATLADGTNETAVAWRMFNSKLSVKEGVGVFRNESANEWYVSAGGEAVLYGRYLLQFDSDVTVAGDDVVTHVSPPQLYVREIGMVRLLTDGRYNVRFTTNSTLLIGRKVREALSNEFRMPEIGFLVITNQPLPNSDVVLR